MMDKILFNDYGIVLIERNGQYYIKYYSGGIVMHETEERISLYEARKAQLSEKDAYEVLIAIEKRQALITNPEINLN